MEQEQVVIVAEREDISDGNIDISDSDIDIMNALVASKCRYQ